MKILGVFIIVVCIFLVIWILGTIFAIQGIESPKYKVLEKKEGYEIRKYASYIVAEVSVTGEYEKGLNKGFRVLAGYIFGGNIKKESMSMTSPVTEIQAPSQKISMTTPVSDTQSGSNRIIQFSMPSKYSLSDLPTPTDPNIKLKKVEEYIAAVLFYRGYATQAVVEKKKNKLASILARDNIMIQGDMTSAQYNPPLSFPLLRKNEIIVAIEY